MFEPDRRGSREAFRFGRNAGRDRNESGGAMKRNVLVAWAIGFAASASWAAEPGTEQAEAIAAFGDSTAR